MCDMGEGEWPEYLLQLEAAASRARARVPRRPPARASMEPWQLERAAAEASA